VRSSPYSNTYAYNYERIPVVYRYMYNTIDSMCQINFIMNTKKAKQNDYGTLNNL